MIVPPELGGRPAAVLPLAVERRPSVFAGIHPSLEPGAEPRRAVEPFEPVLGGEFDHVAAVGRITQLHPQVPEPGRSEELPTTGIGQGPTDGHQFAAIGA
jgi:hypothetical protein